VAFDASCVSGALVATGLRRVRVAGFARVPLSEGALVPSPTEPNLARPEEVRGALRELARTLGGNGSPARLLLPDGVGRLALLDVPAGTDADQFARFRLLQNVPAATPCSVASVRLGRGALVGAAVRRSTLEEYENVAAEAGLAQDRVDLAPLAALLSLVREARGSVVGVILGDAAVSLAAIEGGRLRALRGRRRVPGADEPEWLRAEVERTAAMAGLAEPATVHVVGSGVGALLPELARTGFAARRAWGEAGSGLPEESAHFSWFGAALS